METPDFSNREKHKYNVKCCVKTCGTKASENPSVRFHRFPKPNVRMVNRENIFGKQERIDIQKAWKIALRISNVSTKMVVCSQHFKKEDYFYADVAVTKICLRKNAVPSCQLPLIKKIDDEKNVNRLERRLRRTDMKKKLGVKRKMKKRKNQPELLGDHRMESTIEECNPFGIETDTSRVDTEGKVDMETQTDESNFSKQTIEFKDAEINVNTLHVQESSIVNSIKTDAEISTVTGIESFEILNTIVNMVKYIYGDKFEAENMKMKTKDRIILVYAKLKQNLSYSLLAVMFNSYTAKHVQRIFEEMIQVLSSVLKVAIPWPSREEVRSNLPKCFQGFEDTRIVLDCTEVYIQHPKEVCCQVMTYSYYKSHVTGKVMTGVSPSGTITFISRFYGGRVSDATIFEQSGLSKKLDPGDGIMVDRGFLIDSLCEMNRWKLIRPPFLKDKQQFTKEEALLTSKIASARVHIERSNQRIKTFKIVGSVLPGNLVVLLEEIFTVICATINMSSPILKDDKFMEN